MKRIDEMRILISKLEYGTEWFEDYHITQMNHRDLNNYPVVQLYLNQLVKKGELMTKN